MITLPKLLQFLAVVNMAFALCNGVWATQLGNLSGAAISLLVYSCNVVLYYLNE